MRADETTEARRPRFYGRRMGRKLSPRLEELMATLLPRVAISLSETGNRIDPAALFAKAPERLWLEIGFGGGEHLAEQAKTHPGIGLIGSEVFVNGVASLLSHIDCDGLENVRIFPEDARRLLPRLPDSCLDRVFLLYSDPWPKKRHAERRFVNDSNLRELARTMKPGAELRIASDQMGLVRWTLEKLTRHPDFRWLAEGPEDWRIRPDDWPTTRYEQKALKKGARCVYLRFRRR